MAKAKQLDFGLKDIGEKLTSLIMRWLQLASDLNAITASGYWRDDV